MIFGVAFLCFLGGFLGGLVTFWGRARVVFWIATVAYGGLGLWIAILAQGSEGMLELGYVVTGVTMLAPAAAGHLAGGAFRWVRHRQRR